MDKQERALTENEDTAEQEAPETARPADREAEVAGSPGEPELEAVMPEPAEAEPTAEEAALDSGAETADESAMPELSQAELGFEESDAADQSVESEAAETAPEDSPAVEAAEESSDEMVGEEEPAEEAEAETAPIGDPNKSWYIIHTYSGFERKVEESLRTRATAFGFADQIGQILIPEEEVMEMRGGKKVVSKRLLYPGYVLVEMEMSDELWHHVKNTPRVTGFVGGGNTPVPLTADEVNSILYRQQASAERPRPKLSFEKNETVRIVDGPFTNFSGRVDEVNTERNTLRVLVTIFGRATPVELEFLQVEKI